MKSNSFLRCLGHPALFAANGEPIRFRTKKHLALLVFLAIEKEKPHRRDRLAEFLWPHAQIPEARHSLATGLSILRTRVGADVLDSTRDHVTMRADRIALDLDRLQAGDVLGNDSHSPLGVAAFLEGFDINDAPEFALWKDRQQARLLPAIKDALITLIDRCRRTGDSRQIELLADQMLALDELSEEAIRAKMEARAFAGDRLTALKIFEEWKVSLLDEFGAAPSELVEGIAVRLRRRGWERTTLTDIPNVPTDQWKGRQFVGRANEYCVLYEAWEDMRKGIPANILVVGDSGVGKTTLVDRLTTATGLEGSIVSRVQCYDLERDIPYAAIVSLIHGLLDRPGVSGTPPDSLAELARTIPEVRRHFPSIPPSAHTEGESARIKLTEAFHDMLLAISDEHPVILVVDDAHLADDASLAVLHLVMRRSKGQHIQIVLVARPGELWSSPQFNRLREGRDLVGLREFELLPLSDEESRQLLERLTAGAGMPPGAAARRALLKGAAGVPMVLELLYQDWESHGNGSLALSVEDMTADLGGASAPPEVYPKALERLVRSVDPSTQGVLNLASVLGHRLNDVSLYTIADLSVGQTMTGMAELVSRRVLRDGGKGLEFVNELVRTAAYLGVPSPVRRALHGHIADRLIARDGPGMDGLGLEIAWHCMRAGRVDQATLHLMTGARDAVRAGAPQEAERALSSALPALEGESLEAASILLAEVLHEQGRSLEALDVLSGLRSETSTANCDRVTALTALVRLTLGPMTAKGLREQLPDLDRIVRSAPNAATRAMAGRAMAYIVGEKRHHGMTDALLESLESIPNAELDADSLGQLALAKALLLFSTGDPVKAFEQALSGTEELKRRDAANLVMLQLEGGLGSIKLVNGRYEEALPHYEHAFTMANRLGNDHQVAMTAGNVALCCGRLGRYVDQLAWTQEVPPFKGADFAGFVEIQLAYSRAFAWAMRGRADQIAPIVDALEGRLVGPIPAWMLQGWYMWKADLLLLGKQPELAISTARAALTSSQFVLLSPAFAGPYSRWLGLTVGTTQDETRARQTLKAMVDQIDHYDALDQVEILCSLARLESKDAFGAKDTFGAVWREITERLDRLPTAIQSQLSALGQLPS
jgi:DNA-binding SARP family transcriptional activator/tetratricopeptide (TPR) repeat protein